MITCIEESNEGYEWNWDEKTLKGKKIGVLFGREQYMMNGQKKWATKARAVLRDWKCLKFHRISYLTEVRRDLIQVDLMMRTYRKKICRFNID